MTDTPPPVPILGLTVRRQFLHVAQGRKASGRFVLLQVRPSDEAKHAVRFGLTASKKVGNAVVRNRARRRLRAAMRLLLPLHGSPGNDYVAVARTATAEAPWPSLLDDLSALFIRLAHSRRTLPDAGTSPPDSGT